MNPAVSLQPFRPPHLERLRGWLKQSHVAPWYPDPESILVWAARPPPGGAQAIIASGVEPVGWLRWQRVDRQTLDSLGLPDIPESSVDADILIGVAGAVGKGAGPAALATLVATLRDDGKTPLIGLTSALGNTLAHRAFEKAGFRIARQYDPDGRGSCHLFTLDLRSGG